MKILIISTNSDEAGAPRHVESIINGLESSFEFAIIFGENGPVSQRLIRNGHNVKIIKEMRTSINPIKDFISLLKIISFILEIQPDIIHCHSAKAGMLGRIAAFLLGKKWVYTVHGWGWRGLSRSAKVLIFIVEAILSKLPRGFYIYVAKDVMNDARSLLKIKQEKGVVIYNGVSSIEASLPVFENPLIIMMPARVCSAKDHQSLVMAFERINDPEMRLILCGAGTDAQEFVGYIESLAPKSLERISFLGQRSDIDNIYSQSHIVAVISNFEALPLSIIEAMSCSRAVIATNVGGIPELIENESNGILVNPNDIDGIVQAIYKCKNVKYRIGLGVAAKNTYKRIFTEKSMLLATAEIYQSLRG